MKFLKSNQKLSEGYGGIVIGTLVKAIADPANVNVRVRITEVNPLGEEGVFLGVIERFGNGFDTLLTLNKSGFEELFEVNDLITVRMDEITSML